MRKGTCGLVPAAGRAPPGTRWSRECGRFWQAPMTPQGSSQGRAQPCPGDLRKRLAMSGVLESGTGARPRRRARRIGPTITTDAHGRHPRVRRLLTRPSRAGPRSGLRLEKRRDRRRRPSPLESLSPPLSRARPATRRDSDATTAGDRPPPGGARSRPHQCPRESEPRRYGAFRTTCPDRPYAPGAPQGAGPPTGAEDRVT